MLDSRELATVLAALRFWEVKRPQPPKTDITGWPLMSERDGMILDIANCGGTVEPLLPEEIDTLCERLNTSRATSADDLLQAATAIAEAHAFIEGFEEDEQQEGIPEMLQALSMAEANLRAPIANAEDQLVDLLCLLEPDAIRRAFAKASPAGVFKLDLSDDALDGLDRTILFRLLDPHENTVEVGPCTIAEAKVKAADFIEAQASDGLAGSIEFTGAAAEDHAPAKPATDWVKVGEQRRRRSGQRGY